jgi:hypothetical protein
MFDFPNSPTVGQTTTGTNNVIYTWDGAKWIASGMSGAGAYVPISGGTMTGALNMATVGFNGTTAIAKPTVVGACAGNTATKALLTTLSNYGLVIDSTTA